MTREEILNMPADRETDKLIVECMMGGFISAPDDWSEESRVWFFLHKSDGALIGMPYLANRLRENTDMQNDMYSHSWRKFQPSADIADTWMVAEKIIELFGCDVSVENRRFTREQPRVCLCKIQYGKLEYDNPNLTIYVSADTAPLAICRAALLARGLTNA